MAGKKNSGRLVSSAGLVTYYDSEDKRAVHISPKTVLVFAGVVGIIVVVLNHNTDFFVRNKRTVLFSKIFCSFFVFLLFSVFFQ